MEMESNSNQTQLDEQNEHSQILITEGQQLFDFKKKTAYNSKSFWVYFTALILLFLSIFVYFLVMDIRNISEVLTPTDNSQPLYVILTVTLILIVVKYFLFLIIFSILGFVAASINATFQGSWNYDYCSHIETESHVFVQKTQTLYSFIRISAYFICFISLSFSTYQMLQHCSKYNYPRHQRYVIRIIFTVPYFGILTLLGIEQYHHYLVWVSLRDIYESFLLYRFYLGSDTSKQLQQLKENLSTSSKLVIESLKNKDNLSFFEKAKLKNAELWEKEGCIKIFKIKKIKITEKFFTITEKIVLFYVFAKLIFTVSVLVMYSFNVYCENDINRRKGIGYNLIKALNFVGVFASVVSALILAKCANLDRGVTKNLMKKFWTVKGFVICIVLQSLVIPRILQSGQTFLRPSIELSLEELSEIFIQYLTLIELIILSISQFYLFSFKLYDHNTNIERELEDMKQDKNDEEYLRKRNEAHPFSKSQAFSHAMRLGDMYKNALKLG
ncbi:hypothetical protein HK099_002463 [Clydaea vesicula]|uniref:Transmembrane protein n=1 Tax=Clydaea vesicula TaxID=447962 RepID=A0AAD5XZA2_9FUNG|nr:hypothetical protein HK099_002463 [Clydaea vesicula]